MVIRTYDIEWTVEWSYVTCHNMKHDITSIMSGCDDVWCECAMNLIDQWRSEGGYSHYCGLYRDVPLDRVCFCLSEFGTGSTNQSYIQEQGIYLHHFVWNRRVAKLCLLSLEQGKVPRHSVAHLHPKLRGDHGKAWRLGTDLQFQQQLLSLLILPFQFSFNSLQFNSHVCNLEFPSYTWG